MSCWQVLRRRHGYTCKLSRRKISSIARGNFIVGLFGLWICLLLSSRIHTSYSLCFWHVSLFDRRCFKQLLCVLHCRFLLFPWISSTSLLGRHLVKCSCCKIFVYMPCLPCWHLSQRWHRRGSNLIMKQLRLEKKHLHFSSAFLPLLPVLIPPQFCISK